MDIKYFFHLNFLTFISHKIKKREYYSYQHGIIPCKNIIFDLIAIITTFPFKKNIQGINVENFPLHKPI